jgi:hypothetical protein
MLSFVDSHSQAATPNPRTNYTLLFRCEEHLYKRLRPFRWLVGRSVPHDAITWKTSYVTIASRRGGGRGN